MKRLTLTLAALTICAPVWAYDGAEQWGGHLDESMPNQDFRRADTDAEPVPFYAFEPVESAIEESWGGHLDGAIPDHGPADPNAKPVPFKGGWGGHLDGSIPGR